MKLLGVAAIRAIERTAIDDWGIPGDELMARAAASAWRRARVRWPHIERVIVVCGSGNNGGDGLVLARNAVCSGVDCCVVSDPNNHPKTGEAQRARNAWLSRGGIETDLDALRQAAHSTLVVDAVLGIGLREAPAGWALKAIEAINAHPGPVLALDCPSGLDADTGATPGAAVRADLTVTFIAAKRGLFTGKAGNHVGKVVTANLDLRLPVTESEDAPAESLDWHQCFADLPQRKPCDHKGSAGHLLIIGGDSGMGGAAILAAQSALRTGAGRVTLITRAAHLSAALALQPEIMALAIEDPDSNSSRLSNLLTAVDAIVIGPGLGQSVWGETLLGQVLNSRMEKPLLLDADALNLLAKTTGELGHNTVITPHPGEAARLLGMTSTSVEADRFSALCSLCELTGGTVVLKGAGTLVADADAARPVAVCCHGNPGMASGGMGDVLSGVVGALMAQGLGPSTAARAGVAMHSQAADKASSSGVIGLLASDLLQPIRRLRNGESALQN
jgi:NAD(P)H-hydrate epimerase